MCTLVAKVVDFKPEWKTFGHILSLFSLLLRLLCRFQPALYNVSFITSWPRQRTWFISKRTRTYVFSQGRRRGGEEGEKKNRAAFVRRGPCLAESDPKSVWIILFHDWSSYDRLGNYHGNSVGKLWVETRVSRSGMLKKWNATRYAKEVFTMMDGNEQKTNDDGREESQLI